MLYVSTLKQKATLNVSLYVGCQSRQANLRELFTHKNHGCQPSLSVYGAIKKLAAKSNFIKYFSEVIN